MKARATSANSRSDSIRTSKKRWTIFSSTKRSPVRFHFTPGNAYEDEADNGNRTAVHWDLVLIQRPEKGGGEIYFDDKLIRKDGRFVHAAFEGLNPENLRIQ